MAEKSKKYRKFVYNQAGVMGWYGSSKYNLERFLFLLHRITGIGLILFVIMHILLTSARVNYSLWETVHSFMETPLSHIGMFIVVLALLFHGLNGLRLIINEYGFLLGKPKKPVYPYRKVLKTKGPMSLLAIMIVIGIILLIGIIYEFLLVWGVL